jgi:hypothetical protein
MSNELHQMTQDIQTRIRELAYLMWESAGRQQGMAMEYWLKAESEVLSTLQAAATHMLPGTTAAKTAKTEVKSVPSASAPAIAGKSPPVAESPTAAVGAPATAATKAAARPATKESSAESPSPAEKPVAAKAATRGKTKT